MHPNTRIILEDKSTLHTLIELLLHIEGRGEFIIKKELGREAFLVRTNDPTTLPKQIL